MRKHLAPLHAHVKALAEQDPLEQRFETTIESLYEGDWGGTPDHCCLSGDGTEAWIDDLKYGEGVAVSAYKNDQLLSYAALCLETWPQVKVFYLRIWQPRVEGPDCDLYEASAKEVRAWKENYFARVCAENAEVFAAGEHCRWCRAKSICPKLYEIAKKAAEEEFATPASDILEEARMIDRCLHLLSIEGPLKMAFDAARERLLSVVQAGGRVPGYKVVRRLGNRAWVHSEEDTLRLLEDGGVDPSAVTTRSLLSPAQVEKVTKQKALVAELVHRPFTGVKLVEESASGEEVIFSTPEQDFS